MDDTKIASFIAHERKARGLTQQALADKLGVTNKAVSKWERGLSCPDISLLAPLAQLLGCSVSELLAGQREENPLPQADVLITDTLQYASKTVRQSTSRKRIWLALTLGALLLFAALVCIICDFAMNQSLSWSLICLISIILAGAPLIPLLLKGEKRLSLSLLAVSLLLPAFLIALEALLSMGKIITPIGLPSSAISLLYLWMLYGLFRFTHWKMPIKIALTALLTLLLNLSINAIVSKYTGEAFLDIWDMFAFGFLALFALIFFLISIARMGKSSAP